MVSLVIMSNAKAAIADRRWEQQRKGTVRERGNMREFTGGNTFGHEILCFDRYGGFWGRDSMRNRVCSSKRLKSDALGSLLEDEVGNVHETVARARPHTKIVKTSITFGAARKSPHCWSWAHCYAGVQPAVTKCIAARKKALVMLPLSCYTGLQLEIAKRTVMGARKVVRA